MPQGTKSAHSSLPPEGNIIVQNVHLPFSDRQGAARRWNLECSGGRVTNISPSNTAPAVGVKGRFEVPTGSLIDGTDSLVLPSLCHSHIHLDKCFILDRCNDLVKGDFAEAMQATKLVKAEFPSNLEDLYSRGARIIKESVEYGVTSMRAHVEIDSSVAFACLEAAQRLQEDYHTQCVVQIAIFAQEPFFISKDDTEPGENFALLKEAASRHGVSAVGSAPYVEPTIEQAKKNISLVFDIVDTQGLDLVDFHLDYNLDPDTEPLVYEVIAQAKRRYLIEHGVPPHERSSNDISKKRPCPRITIGHATRLQLFSAEEWRALVDSISGIPITFVSLPQSDMYMQGRAFSVRPLGAPRGTLRVPFLSREYGIEVAMSVNNVANAFTPQGSLDPLSLCTFGVGIFQAATPQDVHTLVRSITITSKRAIGLPAEDISVDLALRVGDNADFVIVHGRTTLQSAVLDPCFDRTTVKAGKLVAYTRSMKWSSV